MRAPQPHITQRPALVTQDLAIPDTLAFSQPIPVTSLTTTAAAVFTAPDDADFDIHMLRAINTTGTDDSVTVHIVPDAGLPATGNMILNAYVVPANGQVSIFTDNQRAMLEPGQSLQALCGINAAVNIFGFGTERRGGP